MEKKIRGVYRGRKVKLYDLRERKYPNKRGDTFRSLQVFECWVCGALSNAVVMGGWPGYMARVRCPQTTECWHHEMEDRIKSFDKFMDETVVKMRAPFLKDVKDDYVFKKEAHGRRGYFEKKGRGAFRTKESYRCNACGASTNRVEFYKKDGKDVYGPICPQSKLNWHKKIVRKWRLLNDQREALIKSLRKLNRRKIKNDIRGNPDMNLKREVTDVRGWRIGQKCPHRILP